LYERQSRSSTSYAVMVKILVLGSFDCTKRMDFDAVDSRQLDISRVVTLLVIIIRRLHTSMYSQ